MKRIILLFLALLCLPQLGFAQKNAEKCLDQFINLSSAMKTRGILLNLASELAQKANLPGNTNEEAKKKMFDLASDPQTCSKAPEDMKTMFHDDMRAKIRGKSALLAEFSRKKKVDSNHYFMLNHESEKSEITEADVCADAQKEIAKLDECDPDRFMAKEVSGSVPENLTFEKSCKNLQTKIVESQKKAENCTTQKAQGTITKAEILKAIPKKPSSTSTNYRTSLSSPSSFLKEQNRQNPMRSKDQKPSAGGSGQ